MPAIASAGLVVLVVDVVLALDVFAAGVSAAPAAHASLGISRKGTSPTPALQCSRRQREASILIVFTAATKQQALYILRDSMGFYVILSCPCPLRREL